MPKPTQQLISDAKHHLDNVMKLIVSEGDLNFIYIYEGARGEDGSALWKEHLRSFFHKSCLFLSHTVGDQHGTSLSRADVVGMESTDETALIKISVHNFPTQGGDQSERCENAAIKLAEEKYGTYLANAKTGGSARFIKGDSLFGVIVIDPVGLKSEGSKRLVFNGSIDKERLDRAKSHLKKFGLENLFVAKKLRPSGTANE